MKQTPHNTKCEWAECFLQKISFLILIVTMVYNILLILFAHCSYTTDYNNQVLSKLRGEFWPFLKVGTREEKIRNLSLPPLRRVLVACRTTVALVLIRKKHNT